MWFWKSPSPDPSPSSPPLPPSQQRADASACPIDHTSRQAWLNQTRSPPISPLQPQSRHPTSSPLSEARQISSIPRSPATATTASSTHSQPPANSEAESAADASTGNWIYPSERMFFDAMRRKQHDPRAADMATVVPIHNAVNERAWAEIKRWEAGRGGESCGGVRLLSFQGFGSRVSGGRGGARSEEGGAPGVWEVLCDANLTPRAKWKVVVEGVRPPFDRHDWVVDRCGRRVEYVIDFYTGRDDGSGVGVLNFYLDVRPKLNSLEGWRMRATRAVGW